MEQTEGIVLRSFDVRETSKLAVFYTRDFGVLKGLAKGARKKQKYFGSSLELFSYDYISFYKSRNGEVHLIGKCEQKNFYAGIRENILKSTFAAYWMEIVQELIRDKDEKLFDFLLSSLAYLEKEPVLSPLLLPFFELNLLKLAGYGPVLNYCVSCKKESDTYKFSPILGGIICPDCYHKDYRSIDILPNTITLMNLLTKTQMDKLSRISATPKLLGQVKGVIHYYLFHSIGKRPKMLRFIDETIKEKIFAEVSSSTVP
ncbi:MAG: DNA repair protein RecO [Candidatus Ratteibacteria bacterium]|nr:DNA repair protein RecO [Candidatus Ratteibacteria bacterium]